MNRIQFFGLIGFLLYFCCYVCGTLKIKEISGPESVVDGSTKDLILDCDFEAVDEEDVVVKWFFNGLDGVLIYQWIVSRDHADSSGPLKDFIDTSYKVSSDPGTMLRALKFKSVSAALSGNYTCKVSSDGSDDWKTKQVIVYSPATSFEMYLNGAANEVQGDEVVLCYLTHVAPKPNFDLYISGSNGSLMNLPETFAPKMDESEVDGFYNLSITLPFNSTYLEDGTTKFVCQFNIPGTNYSDSKTVEHAVDPEVDTQTSELLYEEDYPSLNSTSSPNSTEETSLGDNGEFHVRSSLLTVLFLLFSLVLAT